MLRRLAWFVVGVLLAAGAGAWWVRARTLTPYRGFAGDDVFVEVPPGSGVSAIAQRLADAGVVPDAITFQIAARWVSAERHLKAGEYRFAEAATPFDIVTRLRHGDVFTRTVTFPEGLTIREMAEIFQHSGLGTADEFESAASESALVSGFDPEAESLEGYLFPDTYALPRHAGAAGTVHAMVARFQQAFDAKARARASDLRLNVHDVITLASIVEKETAAPGERPMIAAVYLNRLKQGMLLQCDPTVIYALMLAGRWNGNLTRNDLAMGSPYNTYRYPGLPPGPIASPGRASIDAVLHPADVSYLYFVSRNDGTHVFATTLAEHNRNVAKWQVNYFKRAR